MFVTVIMAASCGSTITTTTTPKYEVVEKNQSGTKLVINVYTKEKTAAGLVKINDELLRNNLANNDTLLFNYFNDKETAKTYFNKIASASASKPMLWQPLHGGWAVIKSY